MFLNFFFFFFRLCHVACGRGLAPGPGTELRPWQWKHWGLTTEPPGNSWKCHFDPTLHWQFGYKIRDGNDLSPDSAGTALFIISLASVKSAIVWLPVLFKYSSPALLKTLHPLKSDILKRHHVPGVFYFHCVTGYWLNSFNLKLNTYVLEKSWFFFISLSLLFTLFLSAPQWLTYWTS